MVQYAYTNNTCTRQLLEGIQRAMFAKVAKEIAMVPEKDLAQISGLSSLQFHACLMISFYLSKVQK